MTLAANNAPWADTILPFTQSRNDLYATVECNCPSPLFIGSDVEHIMKHKIRLTGYDDSNFFDRVNAQPRESECRCGRRYRYQWWSDGVAFAFLASAGEAGTAATTKIDAVHEHATAAGGDAPKDIAQDIGGPSQ